MVTCSIPWIAVRNYTRLGLLSLHSKAQFEIFFFFFFFESPRCAANCLQHVHSSSQGTIVCKSRATHTAISTCNVSCATWYEGTAHLLSLDRVEIAFTLALLDWLKPLTDEGGEETGAPGKKPRRRASENAPYKSPKIQAPSETRTRTTALVAG